MNRHPAHTVVLASASETRAQMLRNAGLAFICDAPATDETSIKAHCRSRGDPAEEAAMRLAECKARDVAPRHPGALVIGADQLLDCADAWLDKPASLQQARETLQALRGQAFRLVSGIAVVRDGTVFWRHAEVAKLAMRPYSDAFIEAYLEQAEDEAVGIVGACRLEGIGVQAIARIDGDHFTILGLPLLPLLDFLRAQGVLLS